MMNWKVRHEGSPEAVERTLPELEQGLADGVWETTAPNTYSFTMLQLLFDPNFTGALVGTLKTRGTIVVHGRTIFSGEVAVDITDTDGNLLFSGGGAVDGKRIVSEPLN